MISDPERWLSRWRWRHPDGAGAVDLDPSVWPSKAYRPSSPPPPDQVYPGWPRCPERSRALATCRDSSRLSPTIARRHGGDSLTVALPAETPDAISVRVAVRFCRCGSGLHRLHVGRLDDRRHRGRELARGDVDLIDCFSAAQTNGIKFSPYPGYSVNTSPMRSRRRRIAHRRGGMTTELTMPPRSWRTIAPMSQGWRERRRRRPAWPIRAAKTLGVKLDLLHIARGV